MLVGPKGMSNDARDTIARAIAEVLSKPDSKTRQFISKQYPPEPVLIAGDELTQQIKSTFEANKRLLKAVSQ